MNLLNTSIDYSLFEKYDKEYFFNNLIVPVSEDELCLTLAICKDSNVNTVNNNFNKLLKFKEFEVLDIRFALSNLELKINLFNYATHALYMEQDTKKSIQVFINTLIGFSINSRASDIHIEVYQDSLLFKLRIDGMMKTFFSFKKEFFKQVSSYIKLLSNLDITQTRLPMDNRFTLKFDDKRYDFRVSTMPMIEYESIVIRILDNSNVNKSLVNLGLSDDIYHTLREALKLTQGLILISGPTGSGKTTTLYSLLKELNTDEKKIITVEDPVEYKIDSISQIPVNTKIGLTYELILKNILRQDPDIIFIGEIRDKFSLNIALQASLTGHLVLASIHANSAIEVINRVFDLDADPFLVSTTLRYVMAQRLVLSYCEKCASKGCEYCNFTKFHDRSCIAEILKIDENISSMIFKKEDINEIRKYLKKINFKTLLDNGKQKVQEGKTSIEEVYKVISY